MRRGALLLSMLVWCVLSAHAQMEVLRVDTFTTVYYNSVWWVTTTDTLVQATLAPIEIWGNCKNARKKKSYDRLQAKVIKVYPYARMAGDVMQQYAVRCQSVSDPHEQARLLDQAEESLKQQFEKDLRSMTISEGIILIKLIDRETGKTSYKLVQELKGRFSAFMWQSVARIFGHDLKDDYDPNGEDVWIENTVLMIEDGTISVPRKSIKVF